MTNTINVETFEAVESLVSDMQKYNHFVIMHLPIKYHLSSSAIATSINLDKYGVLNFERDFTYGFGVCVKSATKTITDKNTTTYKIELVDSWNHYGTHDADSKWITDDYILVDASIEQRNTEPCKIENFDIYTFMNPVLMDTQRSYYHANHDSYVCVVDMDKLGVLNDNQKHQIKHIMGDLTYHGHCLNGYNTICFVISKKFNGLCSTGLYDLDTDKAYDVCDFPCEEKDSKKYFVNEDALRAFGRRLAA